MALPFAETTKKILERLPRLWKMRKDDSIGAQFLNVAGLTFDDIQAMLEYAQASAYIETGDLTQVDIIYKATLPQNIKSDYKVAFYGEGFQLEQASSLAVFLSPSTSTSEYQMLNFSNLYLIDNDRQLVYVKRPYGATSEYPEGTLRMVLKDQVDRLIVSEDLALTIHHVWNFFDEFGLLLSTPRFYGETNAEYKERLLDVFRHPANSSRRGLIAGIGRDLGLLQKRLWADASQDLSLQESMIVLDSIQVDGAKVDESIISYDESNHVVLLGRPELAGQSKRVTYVAGLSIHELHNKSDTAFQNELYTVDSHASPMLQYYVDIITNRVPIMWGHFVWNESFWDIANMDMSGYGFIPVFHDAQIRGWRNYRP